MSKNEYINDQEYFYVITNQTNKDMIHKINMYDFNQLALLATSLIPSDLVNEKDNYLETLYYYFEENKEDALYDVYQKITYSLEGREFLNIVIMLTLYEREFRNEGIKNELSIKAYNIIVNEYYKLKSLNNEDYDMVEGLQK